MRRRELESYARGGDIDPVDPAIPDPLDWGDEAWAGPSEVAQLIYLDVMHERLSGRLRWPRALT